MAASPPAGFKPFSITDGFIAHSGPYYWQRDVAGFLNFGFQTDARHANPNGVLHGGAILSFLDTIVGQVVYREVRKNCATVSLDSRFIDVAAPGAWIAGRAEIIKLTRSLAFVNAEALESNRLLVAATAIFRLFDA